METKKIDFSFRSANGINTIRGIKILPADGSCKAVLQISHGMIEHYGRYTDFMEFMAQNGFAVYINDHLGHKHSVDNDEQLGFMASENGYRCVLDDLKTTASIAKADFPDAKLFMLGHSMGSFYARVFASECGDMLSGVLISGTGGPNGAAGAGLAAINMMIKVKGEMHRSKTIRNMVFGSYLKKIENPRTSSDWLSRDENAVNAYRQDKYCRFNFTLSGFRDLMTILSMSNDESTYKATPDALPVFVFSGSMDPVGDYGIGVMKVVEGYKAGNCTDVTVKIYDGGRHEMLNEINKAEVYSDVLNWLCSKLEA